jgi:hypothetical protein
MGKLFYFNYVKSRLPVAGGGSARGLRAKIKFGNVRFLADLRPLEKSCRNMITDLVL